MTAPDNPITLADWRRRVAENYAAARVAARTDPCQAAIEFRVARDRLLREHPQTPIRAEERGAWQTPWFPYDSSWRVIAKVEPIGRATEFQIDLADDGILRCARVGHVRFVVNGEAAELTAYWLEGYGGGLWLPFTDASSGRETYGGGRYLYDTIKGADLGGNGNTLVVDFNFAYNPSCAYDERWACPLSPPENRLPFAVLAGERMP
jgi:uncharacterized protein